MRSCRSRVLPSGTLVRPRSSDSLFQTPNTVPALVDPEVPDDDPSRYSLIGRKIELKAETGIEVENEFKIRIKNVTGIGMEAALGPALKGGTRSRVESKSHWSRPESALKAGQRSELI
ncbi:hypothetical protein EVAR_15078_1 [Eumeta japonica]|uniref:Uncharacterized protein n=1 Tax=Eumeta variegata TaxID=151549 RepID=A0A4C1YMI8_EUMVA|nr:hypothetical protein EVAR_15078_1 [Eumeta japonica]